MGNICKADRSVEDVKELIEAVEYRIIEEINPEISDLDDTIEEHMTLHRTACDERGELADERGKLEIQLDELLDEKAQFISDAEGSAERVKRSKNNLPDK